MKYKNIALVLSGIGLGLWSSVLFIKSFLKIEDLDKIYPNFLIFLMLIISSNVIIALLLIKEEK